MENLDLLRVFGPAIIIVLKLCSISFLKPKIYMEPPVMYEETTEQRTLWLQSGWKRIGAVAEDLIYLAGE
jgi:hypothetical protein